MANAFVSLMEKAGHDIKVAWGEVVQYLPTAAALAEIIFPQAKAIPAVVNSLNLIQQAVVTVEQKFTAAGTPTGTGPQKLAQVISMVGPTVEQLLASEGLQYNQQQTANLVNAVVAILNVQPAPATPAA